MSDSTVGLLAVGAACVCAAVFLLVAWRKGRPFASGDVFRASRFSSGNHLLPTQVAITPTSVVQYTPQWFGHFEHSIHIAHIASVSIDTNLLFADVYIETSGGSAPVRCHGHHKRDATRMKDLIERYQSAYYSDRGGELSAGPRSTDT